MSREKQTRTSAELNASIRVQGERISQEMTWEKGTTVNKQSFLRNEIYKRYHSVHTGTQETVVETLKVGIREFREKLANYLLETDVPVAITRHGDTVGYYIPARRKRAEVDRAALKEAASRLQAALAAEGISEEEILKDFKQWRAGRRK